MAEDFISLSEQRRRRAQRGIKPDLLQSAHRVRTVVITSGADQQGLSVTANVSAKDFDESTGTLTFEAMADCGGINDPFIITTPNTVIPQLDPPPFFTGRWRKAMLEGKL